MFDNTKLFQLDHEIHQYVQSVQ